MRILTDIGGTYVRFAQQKDASPAHIKKYAASNYKNLSAALDQYCADHQITEQGEIAIATAGYEENGIWKITNNQDWVINPASLAQKGWNVSIILNDFEASTHSLPILTPADLKTLKSGAPNKHALCILGAGTGLGLGYYHQNDHIQKTHGGHMPIASLNDEHGHTIKQIRETLTRAVVFEDIVSGPGLQKLRTLYNNEKALRLFHEFLGIFAASALVFAHAYGGLYLTGGVITNLIEQDNFDFECFNNALCFNAVDCVKTDIANTPVHFITDPYPALKGLIHATNKA